MKMTNNIFNHLAFICLLVSFLPAMLPCPLCTNHASELDPDVPVVAGLICSLKQVRHLASYSEALGSSAPFIRTSWQVAGRVEQRPTR